MPHVEITREIARRFNHVFGKRAGLRGKGRGRGEKTRLAPRQGLSPAPRPNIWNRATPTRWLPRVRCSMKRRTSPMGDRERLFGYIEGGGKVILTEPQALLTEASKMPGLDGTENVQVVQQHHHPARRCGQPHQRRSAPCPLIRRGSNAPIRATPKNARCGSCIRCIRTTRKRQWVQQGCKSAGIGCLECKQPVIDAVIAEQRPMRERAQKYLDDPTLVRNIVADGCEKARKLAQETLRDVREVMGLGYS